MDENCDCDPHCGLCGGLCTPADHVVYSDRDPYAGTTYELLDIGPNCPDACGHKHIILSRANGPHCPKWCEYAAAGAKKSVPVMKKRYGAA